ALRNPARLGDIAAQQSADQHVIENGSLREQGHVLECLGHPARGDFVGLQACNVLAFKANGSARWAVQADKGVKERRFPCAIRPDKPNDLPARHIERNIVERLQPAEALADVADFQNWRAHILPPFRRRAVPSLIRTRMPRGSIRMMPMSAKPNASCDNP